MFEFRSHFGELRFNKLINFSDIKTWWGEIQNYRKNFDLFYNSKDEMSDGQFLYYFGQYFILKSGGEFLNPKELAVAVARRKFLNPMLIELESNEIQKIVSKKVPSFERELTPFINIKEYYFNEYSVFVERDTDIDLNKIYSKQEILDLANEGKILIYGIYDSFRKRSEGGNSAYDERYEEDLKINFSTDAYVFDKNVLNNLVSVDLKKIQEFCENYPDVAKVLREGLTQEVMDDAKMQFLHEYNDALNEIMSATDQLKTYQERIVLEHTETEKMYESMKESSEKTREAN